jgi:hypothetical protein
MLTCVPSVGNGEPSDLARGALARAIRARD